MKPKCLFNNQNAATMKYTTASVKTFLAQIKNGKVKSDAGRIAKLMQEEEILNTKAISDRTGIKESTVTARIDSLREMGILRAVKERRLSDNSYVTIWAFVSDPEQQVIVSRQYRRKKFVRRLEGLLNENFNEFTSPYLRNFVQGEIQNMNA